MFNSPQFDRQRQLFADQFEPQGADYLYRKSRKAAPIRVTAAERDGFLAAFDRRMRHMLWSVAPAAVLFLGLLAFLMHDTHGPFALLAWTIGLGLILLLVVLAHDWAWKMPARELARRPVAGPALSREEVRRLTFARIRYGQLATAPIGAVVLLLGASIRHDIFHGWGRLWLVGAGALVAFAGVQAIRKWNYERG